MFLFLMEINLILFLGIVFVASVVAYFFGRLVRSGEIKSHRADAISRSRAVLSGQFSEQLAPVLPGFLHNPNEVRFIGKPIDFVSFKGLDSRKIDEVVFVEVKSGDSKLSSIERSLKEAVEDGRVRWEEYRVDKELTGNRDNS
jgi:predicted Holliday junction resolvase-like endonuclease